MSNKGSRKACIFVIQLDVMLLKVKKNILNLNYNLLGYLNATSFVESVWFFISFMSLLSGLKSITGTKKHVQN